MAVSIPPPTERIVPDDTVMEPWYRAFDDMARAISGATDTPSLPGYTVLTLPSATTAGRMIYVSDESGGAVLAFSDGTDWRRVTDRAIVT